jgi:hypothetical protein
MTTAASTPKMATTISSSIKVKPFSPLFGILIFHLLFNYFALFND